MLVKRKISEKYGDEKNNQNLSNSTGKLYHTVGMRSGITVCMALVLSMDASIT